MGLAPGVTPFDSTPPIIEFPIVFAHLPQVLCSTADSFATHRHEINGDLVDMEAFALARVCLAENARFACVKYITDGADSDSATHWEAALDNAARAFLTVFQSLPN
jgi:adenosylhomocysteine nucleosidase